MATADEFRKAKQELKSLIREYEQLTRRKSNFIDPENITTMKGIEAGIRTVENAIESATRKTRGLGTAFSSLQPILQANIAEISKINNSINTGKRAYGKLVGVVRELADEERGISKLSLTQLKNLDQKAKSELASLDAAAEALMKEKGIVDLTKTNLAFRHDLTDTERSLLRSKQEGFKFEQQAVKAATSRLQLERKVTDNLKLTGGVLQGIGNLASSLGLSGFAESVSDITSSLEDNIRKGIREAAEEKVKLDLAEMDPAEAEKILMSAAEQEKLEYLSQQVELGEELSKEDKATLDTLTDKNEVYQDMVDKNTKLVKGTATLGAKIKAVKDTAVEFAKQLTDPAVLVGSMAKGFFAIDEAATNFQRTTGQNAKVLAGQNFALVTSAETLELMASFAEQTNLNLNNLVSSRQLGNIAEAAKLMGLTQKDAANLAMNMQLSGTSTDQFTDQAFEGAKAIVESGASGLNLGNVLQEASKASGAIALSLGNNPTALARATAEAQRLGMSLERMDDIAGSMLDFESSIQAELEAQLLTGKSINLAKAREFALNNNLEGLSREIRENNALSNDFGKANRITQEAMAKAMGMSRDELAKMVIAEKLRAGISADVVAEQMNMRKEQVLQMSAQDKFNTAVGKLQQALGPILDLFVTILTPISQLATGVGYVFSQFGKLGTLVKDTADKYIRPFFGMFNDGLEDAGDGIGFLEAVGKKLGALYLFKMLTGLPDKIKKMVEGIKSFFSTIGLGNKVTKEIGEQAAESTAKAGASATTKVAGKVGAKGLAKMGGKFASKLVPGVGLGFAAADLAEGDYIGAILNSIGGLASFIPGIGTGAAAITAGATTGIDIARDMGYIPFAKGGVVTQPVKGIVGEAGPEAVVPLSKLPEMMGGGLSLEGLNVKFDEMISKLDELTNIKGDVYIDGNKTGQAIFSAATNLS